MTTKQSNTLFYEFWMAKRPDAAGIVLRSPRISEQIADQAIKALEEKDDALADKLILATVTKTKRYGQSATV